VLSPFFDPIIVLFFAGFVMAEVMRRVGLERWAAVTIVAKAATSPVRLYAALLGVSAFLSMWMSNTAAVTVLIPVAIAVTAPFGHVGYRKAAVLGIAYAGTIGGVGSAIGTPANQLAIRFIDEVTGRRISFVEWFGFGLPMVVLFLPLMGVYLWRAEGVEIEAGHFAAVRAEAVAQRADMGRFTGDQLRVLAVFAVVLVLWLTQSWHSVNTGIVALGGAVVLFATGQAEPDDLGRISWPTLLTFGGGLTLGVAMVDSGTADWIVTHLDRLEGTPTIVGVLVAAALALALSTVASNTAAAATLIPLAIPLAGIVGVDPVLLVMTVARATSIDFALVVGTPPTMLAYGTGVFSTGEILRRGLPLDLAGLAILVFTATTIWTALSLV
jgi:sodium-dependent dicarboxylate transporter 2/3/5